MPGNDRYVGGDLSFGDGSQPLLETSFPSLVQARWQDYRTCFHYICSRGVPNIVEAAPLFKRDVTRLTFVISVVGLAVVGFTCRYAWAQTDYITSEGHDGEDWASCVSDDWSCCLYVNSALAQTENNFAADATSVGQLTVIFAGLGAAVASRAFRHYEWLPSSVAFLIYAMLCIISYFSSADMLPAPGTLSATLALMTRYVASDPYANMSEVLGQDVADDCAYAQRFNTAFVALQYVLVACLALLLVICLLGEYVRHKSPKRHQYMRLTHMAVPRLLVWLICALYIVGLIARNIVAFESAKQFEDRNGELPKAFPSTTFPFTTGALDVPTILLVCGAMAVIRGNTRQSISALRISALTSLFYVVLMMTQVLGNMYAASTFDLLGGDRECEAFFDIAYGVNGAQYIASWEQILRQPYPGSTDVAAQERLCQATRTSLMSALAICFLQLCQFFASGYSFYVNQHRQSEVLSYVFPRGSGDHAQGQASQTYAPFHSAEHLSQDDSSDLSPERTSDVAFNVPESPDKL